MNGNRDNPARYFLDEALAPIRDFLNDRSVVEISCQKPEEVWIERSGSLEMERHAVQGLSAAAIALMAERTAAHSRQVVNEENPLLSATLPDGERIQYVLNPTAVMGHCFSIRKQVLQRLTLKDYDDCGAFGRTRIARDDFIDELDIELSRLLQAGESRRFLEMAALNRRSMIVSGGTSTGKTTFLNAVMTAIHLNERLVMIEDVPELVPMQANVVSLIASKGNQGRARVNVASLLQAALRLRPDRIFMGELRGEEAFEFLNAINTGHPGSMTTIHANSPRQAFDRISTLVLNSGVRMERGDIVDYVKSMIPIVVQLTKGDRNAGRGVSEIFFADEVDQRGKRKYR